MQFGREGDGYTRKSPFTNKEKFEGLPVLDAAKVHVNYDHLARASIAIKNLITVDPSVLSERLVIRTLSGNWNK